MARLNFPTRSIQWLTEQLQNVEAEEAAGKSIIEAGQGDSSARKQVLASLEERKRKILHDLIILDPDTYPPEEYLPIRRTRINFS
jgi:hypothetical protein